MDIYMNYNKLLRTLHSEAHMARLHQTQTRFKELVDAKNSSLNATEGETISWDDYQDLYIQAKAEERAQHNFELNTKNKTGDISDYLEVRRPFGTAE